MRTRRWCATCWRPSRPSNAFATWRPAELDGFQASQRYLLIDQRSIDPAVLESSRSIMAALFRIELNASVDVLIEAAATLRAWLAGEAQAPLRRSIATWIARLLRRGADAVTIDEVQALLEEDTMGDRYGKKYDTWEDAFEDRGLQRGLVQGREQGRQEALRTVLKRQLGKRFGDVAPAIAARIDQAPDADLERWIEQVIDAPSLDAVLKS